MTSSIRNRVSAMCLAAVALTGCPGPASWQILVNRTDESLAVRFALRTYVAETTGQIRCPLLTGEQQPRLVDLNQHSLRQTSQWRNLPARISAGTSCEMALVVPAGFALAIQSHDVCADGYRTYGDTLTPRLELLEIKSNAGTATYTDWQASRLFERKNDDFCVFEYR